MKTLTETEHRAKLESTIAWTIGMGILTGVLAGFAFAGNSDSAFWKVFPFVVGVFGLIILVQSTRSIKSGLDVYKDKILGNK